MRVFPSIIVTILKWIDDRENYGDERFNLLGICEGVILHVTYTERGERIRIIFSKAGTET